jgi:hypothetical protein
MSRNRYNQLRIQQLASGTWEPWADVAKVQEHIAYLRTFGASWEAIGHAAGVGAMTVWDAANSGRRIKTEVGTKILSVEPGDITHGRVTANGSKWMLRSLIALGHSEIRMARATGLNHETINQIVRGISRTTDRETVAKITELWRKWWDKVPTPGTTKFEKRAITVALNRAKRYNWPTPANLEVGMLEDPDYVPTGKWLPATGTGRVA